MSTTYIEAYKKALLRQMLHVCQLLTPPGTCLINNATRLNAMCDTGIKLPYINYSMYNYLKKVLGEKPDHLNT